MKKIIFAISLMLIAIILGACQQFTNYSLQFLDSNSNILHEQKFRYEELITLKYPQDTNNWLGIVDELPETMPNNDLNIESFLIPKADYELIFDEEGIEISDYHGEEKILTIPYYIDGIPVKTIGEGAFKDKQILNVNIADSVTNIEDYAFQNNLLSTLVIPNSVIEIGISSFGLNNISTLVLSENLVEIPLSAFEYNSLTRVTLNEKLITIGEFAFFRNELTEIRIPDGVVSIGRQSFSYNNIRGVIIGKNVLEIGRSAFSGNSSLLIVSVKGDLNLLEEKWDDFGFPSNVRIISD